MDVFVPVVSSLLAGFALVLQYIALVVSTKMSPWQVVIVGAGAIIVPVAAVLWFKFATIYVQYQPWTFFIMIGLSIVGLIAGFIIYLGLQFKYALD